MRLCQEFLNATFTFDIDSFPGTADIAVSHALHRQGESGYGKHAFRRRMDMLKSMGYKYAMFTVVANNGPQNRIAVECGAKELDHFVSDRTGNTVLIYGVQL